MTKINRLREEMKNNNIQHYIIPSSDPHQSEYVAEYYKGRAYISGFLGSAGILLVSLESAKLWTDGRYFIQAEKELKDSGIDLMKMRTPGYPTLEEYIKENVNSGETVGFDGSCYSLKSYKELVELSKENNFNVDMEKDLLENVWEERPNLPVDKIFLHNVNYAGKSAKDKVSMVREKMTKIDVENYLLASLDDIAWLFNIRGNDIKFNPVVISYGLITKERAILYVDEQKVDKSIIEELKIQDIDIKKYDEILEDIKEIKDSVYIDPNKVNAKLYSRLSTSIKVKEGTNITTELKAIKNEVEINNLESCQIKDGVAMVKFIKWLKESIGNEKVTEISATNKLSDLRREQGAFGDSFGTIAGYKEHAAMMHYSANEESDYEIKAEGMFLVDSGGQYFDGTTDITRTFIVGEISEEEKRDFTLVLKGHIDLSMAKFLKGTCGINLDILARGPLWKYGIDYKCGTGHGVGFFLNVHEGPQGIAPRGCDTVLEPGMILTNEPGIYKEGRHGIRTENTLRVVEDESTDFGEFYKFEVISYCPIDLNGVISELLSEEEREWLNSYHNMVYHKLSPYLKDEERKFLEINTMPI